MNDSRLDMTWISDAIHGPIDTRDPARFQDTRSLVSLINSTPLDRLKRIKQVFFTPQSYLSADHSRYAHSIGTMHNARSILNHLKERDSIPVTLYASLHKFFGDYFKHPDESQFDTLSQHVLVAALLLDIGELPFSQATRYYFEPTPEDTQQVADEFGVTPQSLRAKQTFTLLCLLNRDLQPLFENYSLELLCFLVAGLKPKPIHGNESISDGDPIFLLRQMLDGIVDADRLDYVYRDAYHTIGSIGSPRAVIETLIEYDINGPIFDDPGPVSLLLALRAHLHTSVYLAPTIRFRTLQLVHLLRGVLETPSCLEFFTDLGLSPHISLSNFLGLDDVSLHAAIIQLQKSRVASSLDSKSRNAMELFLGISPTQYELYWLPDATPSTSPPTGFKIPDDLFYDTFLDQHRVLYTHTGVRIRSDRYRFLTSEANLSVAGGPLAPLYGEPTLLLPMPEHIQVYSPQSANRSSAWRQYHNSIDKDWLPDVMHQQDPLYGIKAPSDTRNLPGFGGKPIFISYQGANLSTVDLIVQALFRQKRHYFLLRDRYQGQGGTPGHNSSRFAEEAGHALIVVSKEYLDRYHDESGGYIAQELRVLERRQQAGEIAISFLSLDPFSQVRRRLQWDRFGDFPEMPFVGEPLRGAGYLQVEEAVKEMLKGVQ